jgi:peroxiredoxin
MEALRPGTVAPDFMLHSTPDQQIGLRDFRGRRLILAFYPADWSPVCDDEMTLYSAIVPDFKHHGAEILGISVDGAWCHAAYKAHHKIQFALLSDFEPKGDVARRYGVYATRYATSERALFVVDETGVIRWSHVSPIGVNPGADGIFDALEAMGENYKVGART